MRVGGQTVALLLLLPALLSACIGDGARETEQASVVSAGAGAKAGHLLRVLVITDEYFPVHKARVTLVGLGVNATTDEWGDAFFHLAQPGRYALHVHRAGFYPNQTRVVIEEGQAAATLRVRLLDAPGHSHYSDFYFYNGLCGPTVYVQGVSDSSDCTQTQFFAKPQARFILGKGLVRGYLELGWEEYPGGLEKMRMEARFPGAGAFANGQTVLSAEGTSPVKLTIPQELLTERHRMNGNEILIAVGLPRSERLAANVQQDFQIDGEFSYFIDAPDVDPES